MGTFNFSAKHNTPHKAVFCTWEDYDEYKESMRKEYDHDADDMVGMSEDPEVYNEWYAMEKETYMEQLAIDLKEAFGRKIDVDGHAYDGKEVCRIGKIFTFAGMNFDITVGIFLESGYYEGFALDWEIIHMCDCYSVDIPDEENAINYLEYDEYFNRCGVNKGLAKCLAPKFIKRCEKQLHLITDKLDKILMDLAPHNMEIGWCCSEYKKAQ